MRLLRRYYTSRIQAKNQNYGEQMVATNNRRVITAHARIVSAISHLEFLLRMNALIVGVII